MNMEIKEGYIPFLEFKTYYRIVNPNGLNTPLLMLHGGPGSTHNSFELLDELAYISDRPIIMYDQLGCGKSIIPNGHEELWNKDTWVNELINLREKLNLKSVHLLGHSWGGMLEIIYMCDHLPEGIKSITLSSTLASASLWKEETHKLLNYLNKEDREVLIQDEEGFDVDKTKLAEALDRYMEHFVFSKPNEFDPECLRRERPDSSESYICAWGKSEFSPCGTLKDYEYLDKLDKIKCPVLIMSGEQDESTPYQNLQMFDRIKSNKRYVLFQYSRHRTYYEEKEKYISTLKNFLSEFD